MGAAAGMEGKTCAGGMPVVGGPGALGAREGGAVATCVSGFLVSVLRREYIAAVIAAPPPALRAAIITDLDMVKKERSPLGALTMDWCFIRKRSRMGGSSGERW